ncbi:MAG TPA: ABC transporter ATP-binding protein, partial [Dehalococcoidia bacterium]|nr:ABC transporter ATP-binding protein [Dehalococcoidia bacterium]
TNGLDPLAREHMLDLIGRVVHEMGINILVSSHLLDDVQRVSNAVVILDRGRVVAQGPLDKLLADTDLLAVHLLEPCPAFVQALRQRGCQVEGAGAELTLRLRDETTYDAVRDAAVETGAGITYLKRRSRSLEEVFLQESSVQR